MQPSDVPEDSQLVTVIIFTLLPTVVAFSFIVFVFYRARRESFFKQKEAELKLSISEVEMKALRSQMNPHFIFNCLNSIHHYMQGNDLKLTLYSTGAIETQSFIRFCDQHRRLLRPRCYQYSAHAHSDRKTKSRSLFDGQENVIGHVPDL